MPQPGVLPAVLPTVLPKVLLFAPLVVLALLFPAGVDTAHAQPRGWMLSAGVPLAVDFADDEQSGQRPAARSATGLRLAVTTPWRVGVGLARFDTAFDDARVPWQNRDVALELIEVHVVLPFPPLWLALGYGQGEASFAPRLTTDSTGVVRAFLPSDADAWFLLAAFAVAERWDAVLGIHLVTIAAQRTTDTGNGPALASGDLSATVGTLGIAYRF